MKKKTVKIENTVLGESRATYDRNIVYNDKNKVVAQLVLTTYDKNPERDDYLHPTTNAKVVNVDSLVFSNIESFDRMIREVECLKKKFIEAELAVEFAERQARLLNDIKKL